MTPCLGVILVPTCHCFAADICECNGCNNSATVKLRVRREPGESGVGSVYCLEVLVLIKKDLSKEKL